MDDLMYSYHFADNIVDQIYVTYSKLNLEAIAHKIQSMYRREISFANERRLTTKKLVKLRYLQFLAIKMIATFYIHKEINELQLKTKLSEILSSAINLLPKL